jgi:RNA polymerase sigma-70 factor (ECF subfamily)
MDIVHNVAVDTARIRRPYPMDESDLHRMIGATTQTPERHALARETATELGNALAELPDEQARAVVLTAIYGLTARELARLETIPLGTAKSRIRTALTKLHRSATPDQSVSSS